MVPFARLSLSLAESKLLKSCTEGVKPAEDIPPTAALIIDGMAILQSMKEIPATFKELVTAVFDSVSLEVRLWLWGVHNLRNFKFILDDIFDEHMVFQTKVHCT